MTENHPRNISAADAAIINTRPAIDAGSKAILGTRKTVVDWEDAAQDTVVKLLESQGFTNSANQAGFARTTAKNTAKDLLKHEAYSTPTTTEILEGLSTGVNSSPENVIVNRSEIQRQHESLRAAIEDLPEGQQAVIKLYLEGLSTDEIASRLGIARGTVGPHRSRGLKKLRSQLVGQEVDSG